MKIIITPQKALWSLRRLITLNEGIVARTDAAIAPMVSKKSNEELQIMNNLAKFAPSYGKRVR
jgi:hypothetical protein